MPSLVPRKVLALFFFPANVLQCGSIFLLDDV